MNKRLIFLLCFWVIFQSGFAQLSYRLKADILTKSRMPDSTFQVSKGIIHYDINSEKIIFDFTFPEKEKIVLYDTIMYQFREGKLLNTNTNFLIPNQSFFHFILLGNTSNFGFEQTNFEAKGIEKKKDLVITTWIPPENVQEVLSKVLVATKNKKLYSITMFAPNGKVINRQILKNYHLIEGLDIPFEILIATYVDEQVMYQIINLDNVVINETGNNNNYNYDL